LFSWILSNSLCIYDLMCNVGKWKTLYRDNINSSSSYWESPKGKVLRDRYDSSVNQVLSKVSYSLDDIQDLLADLRNSIERAENERKASQASATYV